MKMKAGKLVAVTLALTLAAPCIVSREAEAAGGQKPVLGPYEDNVVLYTGKTKTFYIQNVKKSNVKSLKVKSSNTGSVKVVKKILTKKKVGFKLKGGVPTASFINVSLKLKKPQANSLSYKFSLTVFTGVADEPEAFLVDSITNDTDIALVQREGTAKGAELTLLVGNQAMIGQLNIDKRWYMDGKFLNEMQGVELYYPPTSSVSDRTGGYDEMIFTCKAENCLSGVVGETSDKVYRLVTPDYVTDATKAIADFRTAHSYTGETDLPTDDAAITAYLTDFKTQAHRFGIAIGVTNGLIERVRLLAEKPEGSDTATLTKELRDDEPKLIKIAKKVGIRDEDVKTYWNQFGLIAIKSMQDPRYSLKSIPVPTK